MRGRRGGRGLTGTGRAERLFAKGELALVLLSLAGENATHGYELIRKIKSLSKGQYAPSSGMVYPALADLADEGLLSQASEEGGRKSYVLTEAGRARVSEQASEIAALTQRLAEVAEKASDARPAVQRALASLDMALSASLADAGSGRVNDIVEILDATTRQIERLDD